MTTTTHPRRLALASTELAIGDIVHTHGLDCLLLPGRRRDVDYGRGPEPVASFPGLVLNADQAIAAGFPPGYLRPEGGRQHWTVQGNDHAPKWSVSRGQGGLKWYVRSVIDRHADARIHPGSRYAIEVSVIDGSEECWSGGWFVRNLDAPQYVLGTGVKVPA